MLDLRSGYGEDRLPFSLCALPGPEHVHPKEVIEVLLQMYTAA
jgi:hypothetical protein